MTDILSSAYGTFTTLAGHSIRYRRLVRSDIADLPNFWPVVNTAIYYYLAAM